MRFYSSKCGIVFFPPPCGGEFFKQYQSYIRIHSHTYHHRAIKIWTYFLPASNLVVEATPAGQAALESEPDDAAQADSLLEMGIAGMKIWPFDYAAEASSSQYNSPGDLAQALEPFEKICNAVGHRIDVMAELHSMWRLKIACALEEFDPLWVEDSVFMDHLDSLGEVASSKAARPTR